MMITTNCHRARGLSSAATVALRLGVLVAVAWLLSVATATAQRGLAVDEVFSRFGRAKGCTMVEMHDTKLGGHRLDIYKSLTYERLGTAIEPYLEADRRRATKIREVVESGKVVSGYYMMPPLSGGRNRYVLFVDAGKGNGAVIYIEGRLSPDDIMKLCFSRR